MKDSIKKSTEFVNANKGKEITMVGHSKGGAEATANAVANNRNAITFNTAPAVLGVNGLSDKDYTGSMTHYVVKGGVVLIESEINDYFRYSVVVRSCNHSVFCFALASHAHWHSIRTKSFAPCKLMVNFYFVWNMK
ncbi:hypothetical protein [Paenibacillus alvei]|uniref:hypothetical protein n=1 Tax=Paenibacillus alvei TaxID=44250 RepID=UPI00227E91D5|nr:hypothetical protein [Paenibacillus alvei]